MSQSLAAEVAELGVKTLVEPGGSSTDWAGPSAVSADKLDAYEPVREANAERFSNPDAIGAPEATGAAILELVDAADPPLRVFFGATPLSLVRDEYANRIETWEQWNELSQRAHGNVRTEEDPMTLISRWSPSSTSPASA